MPRDIHRAPTVDSVAERAQTQSRAEREVHPLEPYIAWLERIAERLAAAGATTHLMSCERLIGELRRIIRVETDRAGSPLQPEIAACFGGMKSILRALRSGELPLTADLRAELVELVREVTETVLEVDLIGMGADAD